MLKRRASRFFYANADYSPLYTKAIGFVQLPLISKDNLRKTYWEGV